MKCMYDAYDHSPLLTLSEWGTGEVESYTNSSDNIKIIPNPFEMTSGTVTAPDVLHITAFYVPGSKYYPGLWGVSTLTEEL